MRRSASRHSVALEPRLPFRQEVGEERLERGGGEPVERRSRRVAAARCRRWGIEHAQRGGDAQGSAAERRAGGGELAREPVGVERPQRPRRRPARSCAPGIVAALHRDQADGGDHLGVRDLVRCRRPPRPVERRAARPRRSRARRAASASSPISPPRKYAGSRRPSTRFASVTVGVSHHGRSTPDPDGRPRTAGRRAARRRRRSTRCCRRRRRLRRGRSPGCSPGSRRRGRRRAG